MDDKSLATELVRMARSLLSEEMDDDLWSIMTDPITPDEEKANYANRFEPIIRGLDRAMDSQMIPGKGLRGLGSLVPIAKREIDDFKKSDVFNPKAAYALNHIRGLAENANSAYKKSNYISSKLGHVAKASNLERLVEESPDNDDLMFFYSAEGMFNLAQKFHVALTRGLKFNEAKKALKDIKDAVREMKRMDLSVGFEGVARGVIGDIEEYADGLQDVYGEFEALPKKADTAKKMLIESTK
jgi:hypothetical protein